MGRAPCCDKANVKKGPWSPDEDAKLKAFIDQHGTGGNWITLPSKAGLKRCGKSCRLRWINYLRPDIKHGSFTEEEELMIYKLHANIGSRWSLIAAQLPGRTDNDIKNYWNTRLKKKLCERKLDQLSTPKLQRPSPPQDSFTSDKIDDAVMTISPNGKPTATMNGMSSAGDGLLSQFMKPQQYSTSKLHEPTVLREAAAAAPMTSIRQQQPQVGVVKSEVAVVPVEAAADGAEVHEQLLRIESSLRSCISSHPSPASSCSGISTDRSTFAPAGAQCAESSYSDRDEQQNGIQDSDPLLPVMSSAVSPTLLVHSSVQPEVGRGGEVPALEFGPRLADIGSLVDDDVMQAALFAQDESSQTHNRSVLSGAKAEEYSFDRFDVNWWSTMMANTPQKQTPGQRTLIAAPKQQQQQQQQQQHHHHHHQQQQQQHQQHQMQQQQYLPLQHRYGDTFVPTQLCLDPTMQCYMKPTSWNPSPSSCNGNASMGGSIAEYGMHQIRYGQQVSWDNVNWAESR